jgi:hypothetical protein
MTGLDFDGAYVKSPLTVKYHVSNCCFMHEFEKSASNQDRPYGYFCTVVLPDFCLSKECRAVFMPGVVGFKEL